MDLTRMFNQASEDMCSQIHPGGATPNGIEVALHYYCRCSPHPQLHAGAVREAADALVKNELMVADSEAGSGYRFTAKGRAWIELLCSTPFPVQIWIDPRKAKQYAEIR